MELQTCVQLLNHFDVLLIRSLGVVFSYFIVMTRGEGQEHGKLIKAQPEYCLALKQYRTGCRVGGAILKDEVGGMKSVGNRGWTLISG